MKIRAFLLTEKIPFVLSIILAGISVTINHLITRYSQAPLIEYSVDQSESQDGRLYIFTVSNLNVDKGFTDLQFEVALSSSDRDSGAKIVDAHPYYDLPYRTFSDGTITATGESASFKQLDLQPKAVLYLRVKINQAAHPELFFPDGVAVGKDENREAVLLTKSSLITWFVRNEVAVNVWIICILLASLTVYLIKILKHQ